ncbi:hypothetical protein SERLADRAFT_462828, partial [Serpula lacrymans var. lacrymans S7.9]
MQVYLQSFRKHLSSVQEHLDGHVALDLSDDVELASEGQGGTWSGDERDRFFHALTIYSRWRPDLIAAAVKTKNVAEVCHYLFILEETALGEEMEGRGDGVGRAQRDVAMQVSEEWVAKEEGLAAEVLRREGEMAGQWKEHERKIETKQKKQEIYSKCQRGAQENKSRKRRRTNREDESTNEENGAEDGMGGDADTQRAKARAWTAEKTLLWSKDDLLERLDIDHLKAIDALLREDVEGVEFPSQEGIEEERDTPITNHTTAVDDEMIDPALLAISREASAFAPDPSNTPPFPVPPETNNTNPELVNLSPKSRRRYQKRLYMRRKRAQSTGGEVVTEVSRLKPGRKTQSRKKSRQSSEASDDHENKEIQEAEIQDQDDIRHPNIGGTTRPYRIRARLDKMGVDAQWLRDNNMGLFHLSSLGKLMSLYSSLEGESEPVGSISAQFIQSLYALVKTFVTIVVYKAIVSREQEGKLKARTKAWRVAPDQIPAASVKHALEIVGAKKRDKKTYISELQRYACHLSTEEVNDETEDIEKSDDEDANASDGERPTKPALSTYREIYGPLVRPPSSLSLGLDSVACLSSSSSYVDDISGGRTRGTTSLSPSTEPEEVLLQEVDEDVLLAVLKEEEEWDKKDQAEEREYEELLWAGMITGRDL